MTLRAIHLPLTALAVAALGRIALANPLPGRPYLEGDALSRMQVFLVAACVAIEWAVVRGVLRKSLRNEGKLLAVVLVANAISYPLTLWAAVQTGGHRRFPEEWDLDPGFAPHAYAYVAESVAIGVESFIYVVAFVLMRRWSPFSPRPNVFLVLVVVVAANALTWFIGVVFADLFNFRA